MIGSPEVCRFMNTLPTGNIGRNALSDSLAERFCIDRGCVFVASMLFRTESFWQRMQQPFYPPAVAIYVQHFWSIDAAGSMPQYWYGFDEERMRAARTVQRTASREGEELECTTRHTEDAILQLLERQIERLFVIYELTRLMPEDAQTNRAHVRLVSANSLRKARSEQATNETHFEEWLFLQWLPAYLKHGFQAIDA